MVDNDIALALDLTNMQKIKFSLNSIASWPNQQLGDNSLKSRILHLYNLFLLLQMAYCEYCMYKYVKKNIKVLNFIDLGEIYITFLLGLVFLVRLTIPLKNSYGRVVQEFLKEFHLIHYKSKSDFSLQIYNHVEKLSTVAIAICLCQMYLGVMVFNVFPIYKNFIAGMYNANRPINGTFEHSLKHDMPFDHFHDPFFYSIIFVYYWYLTYNVICAICCIDLLLCIIVLHIWGHLTILQHNLNVFARPAQDATDNSSVFSFTNKEERNVFHQLKDLIKQHNMIKEFLSKTSNAFGTSICVYYAFHQLAGCLLLLECSTMDPNALSKFGLLTIVMFQQLVLISVIFELIGTKGDTLVDAVYGLPWECMGPGNRRAVLLFLQNVQTPLALKAANVVPVGVRTMSAILRGSWSYFIMLKTLSD